ncbi:MAG: hypothetical protein J4F43_09630 [Dehalococcoidia bacterium]|nr:hypothetical protein [Dehalococcoidia bacterium]
MGPSASPITCRTCGTENRPQARYCINCGGAVAPEPGESPTASPAASPAASEEAQYGVHRCTFHPEVETGLACGKCGQYICPRCMIQTPVGARCRDCARVTPHPTYDVSTNYFVRASVAAAVVGIVGGILWGALWPHLVGILFLPWLMAAGVGLAIGEAVSFMSNRKRGRGLAGVAVAGVTLSIITMLLVAPIFHYLHLLAFALTYYMAVSRVR